MHARAPFVIFACLASVSCFTDVGNPSEGESDTLVQNLDTAACGTQVVELCEALATASFAGQKDVQVHPLSNAKTWHDASPCWRQLRCAAAKDPPTVSLDQLYRQTLYALSDPNVRFYEKGKSNYVELGKVLDSNGQLQLGKRNRIVFWNDEKIAYDSMSAADFGLWLIQVYRLHHDKGDARASEYLELGLATLGVITDPVDDAGLRTRKKCEKNTELWCSFFHAVTSRNDKKTTAGATLNKSLHPVRDLWRAADTLAEVDPVLHAERIKSLRNASLEGAYQLVYGKSSQGDGVPPNLMDFIPIGTNGKPIQRSWLYYGFNAETGKPHFLGNKGNDWKNCNYHMHDLDLLSVILPRVPVAQRNGFTKKRAELGNRSIIDFIVKTYEIKLEEHLDADSSTKPNGAFGDCGERADFPLDASVFTALQPFR